MQKCRFGSFLAVAAFFATVAYAKDTVDNPEYKYWSGCKAGSWVTHKAHSDMNGMKSESETTTKLLEINADKAVVEATMTMVMAGKPMTMPANKRDVLAKVEKVESKDAPKAEKPKEGDEEIEVGGKKLKCHWTETHTESNGMKSDTKVWMCEEIPGHIAKMHMKMDGSVKGETTTEATKWEKK